MNFSKVIISAAIAAIMTFSAPGLVYASAVTKTTSSSETTDPYAVGKEEMTYMGITMQGKDSGTSDEEGILSFVPKLRMAAKMTPTGTIRNSSYDTLQGIDVSHYQGDIDWSTVKSNVNFAIIKATGRGCYKTSKGALYTDQKFKENISAAIKAGVPVGVYCFSAATTTAEAKAEANYTCDQLKGYNISLPVFIDYEYEKNYRIDNGASSKTRTSIIKAFCETVKSRGYTPGIYSGDNLLSKNVDGASLGKSYFMWVASHSKFIHYYNGLYDMWQYSSKGAVGGINGNVDMDYWYKAKAAPASQTDTEKKKADVSNTTTDTGNTTANTTTDTGNTTANTTTDTGNTTANTTTDTASGINTGNITADPAVKKIDAGNITNANVKKVDANNSASGNVTKTPAKAKTQTKTVKKPAKKTTKTTTKVNGR
ncbi:MAG: hypothetical protein DUD27_05660 [Lachnospiraceae bacterium]|uniref:Uncharacterized protein n=1 Tax=Candidatus Weimeria bifida TaxID=2599074 RepID=A0A6N7IZJ5_9FIRM|nr:hypothetical protein [Candidatus Weimeria bifida]RRF96274.1 MAG: hypothetical protein DUD27_05660 [Lachnospiraceae bacterium]